MALTGNVISLVAALIRHYMLPRALAQSTE
jgi:hypothetical protein